MNECDLKKRGVLLAFVFTLMGFGFLSGRVCSAAPPQPEATISAPAVKTSGVTEANVDRFRGLQAALKRNNLLEIAGFFSFPYKLPYPVPTIRTAEEFIVRINEVLDDSLRQRIVEADPIEDVALMGWRGIMLGPGLVWFHEDDMRIYWINHQTPSFLEARARIIEQMKASLHPSIREFHLPKLEQETRSFRIRVDQMEDETYRYAAWPRDRSFQDEPSLVIHGGTVEYPGSGGNHVFTFTRGSYRYEAGVYPIGHRTSPPGGLVVYQNEVEILYQPFPYILYSENHRVWIEYHRLDGVSLHLWSREKPTQEAPDVFIQDGKVTYTDQPEGNLYIFEQADRRYEVANPFQYEDRRPPRRLVIFEDGQQIFQENINSIP